MRTLMNLQVHKFDGRTASSRTQGREVSQLEGQRLPLLAQVGGLLLLCVLGLSSGVVFAAGKKAPAPSAPVDGKRTVGIIPVGMQIELPDRTIKDFGQAFQAGLTRQLLDSGKFGVSDPKPQLMTRSALAEPMEEVTRGYSWSGSVVPVATLRTQVNALSFRTGSRGERMLYGFDERSRGPFSDGTEALPNEFPLQARVGEPSWFGQSFVKKGTAPFDSRSGLDLGEGFSINVLMAWLTLKYASYHTELHLQLQYELAMGDKRFQDINVSGNGFFFDVAGAYQNYSLGIMVARRDAMEQAVARALNASYLAIQKHLEGLPLMARVDGVLAEKGLVFLGTGVNSNVRAGVLFESVDLPGLVIEVQDSVTSGSIGSVRLGALADVRPGMILHQITALPNPALRSGLALRSAQESQSSQEIIELPNTNFKAANLSGLVAIVSQVQAIGKYILEGIFLPYRIYRYFAYDQKYHIHDQLGAKVSSKARDRALAWFLQLGGQGWTNQIGLSNAPAMNPQAAPVVAVIDSGMDYNHPILHSNLWINSLPMVDPTGAQDLYGWDFVSGDNRPFDDGYHGTELASIVVATAPEARIMPLKVFNAWGVTTSSALYSAFVYAVDHGAQVILCGWATGIESKALEMGIEYAKNKNVAVVVATGDQGVSMGLFPVYPAYYAHQYDNVLPVTAVDATDRRLANANYDAKLPGIAAPGQNILAANPRLQVARVTSTGIAAAMVAGVLARNQVEQHLTGRQSIEALRAEADVIPGLQGSIEGGLRLKIR